MAPIELPTRKKALLDWIYLQRQEGLPTAFDELSLKAIDWKKLHRYALNFPSPCELRWRRLRLKILYRGSFLTNL
jgi:hypothetical protein